MSDQEEAFRDAFEQYSDELFRHASLRLPDRERAVELTQECFLRAWEFVARGGVVEQYRPFLYRVLHNLIIDEYRKRKTVSLDALMENKETATSIEASVLRDEFDLFEAAAVQFDAARALEVLQTLPDNYRVVLTLRYVSGLTPTEIAQFLDETENAVSVRIHRGMRKLRALLTSSTDIQP